MYIIGESYSKIQGWMEGALQTSNDLYKCLFMNKKNKNKEKVYTKKEVSKHNKKNDAWVIYKNNVYNITKWIKYHPGGDIIMVGVGKDITELFDTVGHSNLAEVKINKYKIGRLK